MTFRNAFRLPAACLLAASVIAPAAAAKKAPSNTYTMQVVCFTATPKSPKLARLKSFAQIVKQAPILPESGAAFVLDTSTPTRFRKQLENASKDYDYVLTASGSVTCENKATCPINIPPSPDDLSKAGLTGEWSLTVKDPSTISLDIKELTLNLILPGQTKALPVQTIKTARVISLNRTYILGGTAKQQDKLTSLRIFAICITPGG
jgi:hypothetical protein